jgi:hypothetical protein
MLVVVYVREPARPSHPQETIDHIKLRAHSSVYAPSMAPAVTAQIMASMRIIMGLNGTNEGQLKIRQLHENTRYFRQKVSWHTRRCLASRAYFHSTAGEEPSFGAPIRGRGGGAVLEQYAIVFVSGFVASFEP